MDSPPTLHIPVEHPAFEGHFPGAPLLPGVVLLDEILRAVPSDHWTIASAKFLQPVRPGETLRLECESLASGAVRFMIRSGGRAVASGTLVPNAAAREPDHGHQTG
jgi:3-hydroxyacyl-[acyl-carrier-protein] dehydratase